MRAWAWWTGTGCDEASRAHRVEECRPQLIAGAQQHLACSGPLQLASGTTLVLDETALSAGALNDRGVRNARALADLATTQELEMDFSFHAMRVPTDVNVVAVSGSRTSGIVEGLDASVVLRLTAEPRVARETAASLAEMRAFVARARSSSARSPRCASRPVHRDDAVNML